MKILDNASIEVEMQRLIDAAYSPARREQILRSGVAADKTALNTFLAGMTTQKAAMIAERDFAVEVRTYDAAVARLAKEPVVAKDGTELEPAIPVQVEDMDGNMIANPVITIDAAERVTAQAIVAGASKAVLDVIAARVVEDVVA